MSEVDGKTRLRFAAATIGLLAVMIAGPLTATRPAEAQLSLPRFGKIKLPDAKIITRFDDAQYPAVDPSIPTLSPASLSPSEKPMPAERRLAAEGFQGLLNKIVAAGPRPDVAAKVMMYDDPVSNAQAFGDGSILISTGLVEYLSDVAETDQAAAESMLAYSLSHEYAHVLMRHPQERSKNVASLENIQKAFNLAGTLYLVGRTATIDQRAAVNVQQRQAYQALGVMMGASLVGGFLEGEVKRAVLPGFSRETERDADMLAVDLMQRLRSSSNAPLDPIVGVDQLKSVGDTNKTIITKAATLIRDAGNTTKTAAANLATLAPALMLQKGSTDIGNELKAMAVTTAAGFVFQKLEERRRLTDVHLHDSAERRGDLVRRYSAQFYPVAETAAPVAQAPYSGQVDWGRVTRDLEGQRAKQNAEEALVRGDVPAARTAIDVALRSPIGQSPDVQRIAGAVADAEGKTEVAIGHYRKVIDAGGTDRATYDALIQSHLRINQRTQALAAIDRAGVASGDPMSYLPLKITIHREDGNKAEMDKALAECRAAVQRVMLVQECGEAAMSPEERVAAAQTAAGANAAAPGAASAAPSEAAAAVAEGITKVGEKMGEGLTKMFGGRRNQAGTAPEATPAPAAPTAAEKKKKGGE